MDEHSASALQYGHFGRAVYHPETQSWAFSRTLIKSSVISYSGITKTTVSSPLSVPKTCLQDNKGALPRVHPQLAASWSLIRDERLSHVISTATEVCDPRVSSLFDLGNAADVDNDASGRVVPIAVIATGECGDCISFRKIEEDAVELRKEEPLWMRVPSVGEAEATEWSRFGAPVRQICFARAVEAKPTWMAARLPQSTTIFRPLYHRTPVAMHVDHDGDLRSPICTRNSRLDANPLVEISASQTGGFAHADITFNPWYQKQIAIVDERGNWSIWEISGRQRQIKGNWAADCVRTGSLPWLDFGDNRDLHHQPRHDGWAAIEWVGDVNSFIVADRRCVILYRMEGGQVLPYSVELRFERESEWILDVKRSSYNVSHIFILTTSRIFWFDVAPSASGGDGRPPLYPRLSWRHFRDSEDTTLRLSLLLAGENFYLVLYSRLNHFAQAYQCPTTQADTFSVPDPFLLDIPSIPEDSADSHISRLSILVFKEIAYSLSRRRYRDPIPRPIKLFTLDSNLTLRESVYFGVGGDDYEEEQPLWREVLRVKRSQGGHSNKRNLYRNDFVVDDWDESVCSTHLLPAPHSWTSASATPLISPWTINYTSVYTVATGKLTMGKESANLERQPEKGFKEWLGELKNKIYDRALSDLSTSRTMLEILGISPLLDDIDQDARDLERVVSANVFQRPVAHSQHAFVVLPLGLPGAPSVKSASCLEASSKLDLVAMYDNLVNHWLSNLPHDIPGRTRIMKEKVIRSLAAELLLARINLIPRITDASAGSHTEGQPSHESNAENPSSLRNVDASTGVPAGTHSSLPSSIGVHQAPHPPEGGLDVAVSESGNSELQQPKNPMGTVCTTLSTLTTLKIQKPLSRNAASILSHWQSETDPDTYNWQSSTHELENEKFRLSSRATTPKHRSRKKASQGQSLDFSLRPIAPAVPIVRKWGSQPQNEPPRVMLQSSQVVEDDLPMTQVERGMFGGREAGRKAAVKGRKKKRAAGF